MSVGLRIVCCEKVKTKNKDNASDKFVWGGKFGGPRVIGVYFLVWEKLTIVRKHVASREQKFEYSGKREDSKVCKM